MLAALAALLVFVDPGHDPDNPGATSARGRRELAFNEEVAGRLAKALALTPGVRVERTRAPEESPGPRERARRASDAKASLLVSIHHDSVEEAELEPWKDAGAERLHSPVARGFSLHVRADSPQSVAVARAIADELLAAGLTPTRYHLKRHAAIDLPRGIFDRPQLALLSAATVPAVIVECGFIVHREEEAQLSRPEVQETIAAAIARGAFRTLGRPMREAPDAGR